ncbi:MAG: hypothetical protein A2W25_13515 [candidate division Zixibacteria bacterium RBG_16_53_22]|nr:MAG: hypothetical protein A2W25_13515 [candidate division Zixibacteria bacterium RBG_16_53_22]
MIATLGIGFGTATALVLLFLFLILPSIKNIGPTEVGLVIKRFSFKKLSDENPIAFNGEAGYQADLLMPGFRFKFWIWYKVQKFPWVQVPAGEIGVVIAQVGQPLPTGAKSAVYKKDFGDFTRLREFVRNGGQKGVQRPVLAPGTLAPIHPVGFLIITREKVYGIPVAPEYQQSADRGILNTKSFGLEPEKLIVTRIEPRMISTPRDQGDIRGENHARDGKPRIVDTVGIVTVFEGQPLEGGDIASRLGGFKDIEGLETQANISDLQLQETLLGSKNHLHNNYQDFQAFLDNGGKIGLQHDPLLYGAFNLNPFLVSVELMPMLVVEQGQVAVIKSYVGLPTVDTSGAEFKYGSLVRPGRRGIWQEALRTGKYPINPHCYVAEVVPTAILTLNWAEAVSQAHNLDRNLKQITAKSREGFIFNIDLQVQIHVPDTKAPRVISMVGTMQNLVNEVLQAAVGNHFRDKIQSMPAVSFIETRQSVQEEAFHHISEKLSEYQVETKGVYIQDVVLPEALVIVLTQREIANQQIETFKKQKQSQEQRVLMENTKGTADMQAELAKSRVEIDIKGNRADARKAEADGEATYIEKTGTAQGAQVRAVGLARAEAFERQVAALGQIPTAIVNSITALAENGVKIMPETLVTGGGSALDGALATLMGYLRVQHPGSPPAHETKASIEKPDKKSQDKM